MSPKQPLNRQFYNGPDVETLNILIELGEIVGQTESVSLDIAPTDLESARTSLLHAAAQTIQTIKALRRTARRVTEPVADPKPAQRTYDFRLPVFGGDVA